MKRKWRRAKPYGYCPDDIKTTQEFLLEPITKPTPEMELAAAVMGEALIDLQRGPVGARGWRAIYNQTRQWVSSDSTSPYSFSYLCSVFDLDEGAAREMMLDIVPTGRGKSNIPALRASPHGLRRSIGVLVERPQKSPKRMSA